MALSIREAERKDIPALRGLVREISGHKISPEQMENCLRTVQQSPIDSLHVYEEDGTVLGMFAFRVRENLDEVSCYGEVSAIVVAADMQGQGIGRFMMEHAETLAEEKGCKGTWLVSGFGREEQAHSFYRKLGYEINGYRFVKT